MNIRSDFSDFSYRERDHDYKHIIAQLNPFWRVITCKDGIQWVLQKRDGQRFGQSRWTGVSYFLTRRALIEVCSGSCGIYDEAAMQSLGDLPEHFSRTHRV